MSIFDRIGGTAAVAAAVDDLYRRVIADPRLAPHLDGIDMQRLKGHQRALLAAAIGEPEPYPGPAAGRQPNPFDLRRDHLDLVVAHLVDTLTDLGVDDTTLEAVAGRLVPRHHDVATERVSRAC